MDSSQQIFYLAGIVSDGGLQIKEIQEETPARSQCCANVPRG
jgi:hypothetical protein